MSQMSRLLAYKHYQRALNQWPIDVLRPQTSFQATIQHRIERGLKPSHTRPQDRIVANEAQAMVVPALKNDHHTEIEEANTLYSLLENRYMDKYLVSDEIRKPLSNPEYYDNLLRELEEAPRRPWLERVTNKWKGFLRLK